MERDLIMSLIRKIYHKAKKIIGLEAIKEPIVGYKGNYASFTEANKQIAIQTSPGGYDSEAIFKKVSESTLKVLKGEAVFERDSFLFYEKQINYNLLMYLYKIYIKEKKLDVLDFGGALGSTYLQHKTELEEIGAKWTVTEQEHFVTFGKKCVAGGNLSFATNEELNKKRAKFNVLLFSSVLQYIEDADSLIRKMCKNKTKHIVIERTPVSNHTRYWIETVHEPIYEAVYPCCVFDEKNFIKKFTDNGYNLIDSWKSLVDSDIHIDDKTVVFKSFVFELR